MMLKEEDEFRASTYLCFDELAEHVNEISGKYLPAVMIQALLQVCSEIAYQHKSVSLDEVKKKLSKQIGLMMDYCEEISRRKLYGNGAKTT